MLLVEQNARVALRVANSAYVLANGRGRPRGLSRHAARQFARSRIRTSAATSGGRHEPADRRRAAFDSAASSHLTESRSRYTQAEIAAIIGPNGPGKTSLLNSISGLYVPQRGRIEWETTSIVGRKPHHIARLGVARTFQNLGLFASLSVLDNLLLGRHVHLRSGKSSDQVCTGRRRSARRRRIAASSRTFWSHWSWDTYARLASGTLAYGLQKRVELGRALAQSPRLLLLDEPMAGMNAEEKSDMVRFIRDVHSRLGITVVMIEHDMNVVMDVSHRIHVLDFGRKIGEGTADEIRSRTGGHPCLPR